MYTRRSLSCSCSTQKHVVKHTCEEARNLEYMACVAGRLHVIHCITVSANHFVHCVYLSCNSYISRLVVCVVKKILYLFVSTITKCFCYVVSQRISTQLCLTKHTLKKDYKQLKVTFCVSLNV